MLEHIRALADPDQVMLNGAFMEKRAIRKISEGDTLLDRI